MPVAYHVGKYIFVTEVITIDSESIAAVGWLAGSAVAEHHALLYTVYTANRSQQVTSRAARVYLLLSWYIYIHSSVDDDYEHDLMMLI